MTSLGVNLPADPRYSAEEIAATGARWARFTYRESIDLTQFLQTLRFHTIGTVCVLDSHPEALGTDDNEWQVRISRANQMYGNLVSAWQIGNEWDAEPNAESSWRMEPGRLNYLNRLARNALPGRTMWLAAACSGQPSRLNGVDLSLVSAICVHPYAKEPNSPELEAMISGYLAYGKPVVVTEYDSRTPGMSACLAADTRLVAAMIFAYHDDVQGFGMVDQQGNARPSYYEFQQAAAFTATPPATGGITVPQFNFGIATKAAELQAAGVNVGQPLEDETYITPEYSIQFAEGGVFVYSTKSNRVHFLAA